MGLFSFTQGVAIDLGTANTIITINDKIVVDEPSVVALDARTDKVLAVGKVAREMYEKTHPNIRTIRPLREGVIADFYAAEQMIRGFIKIASGRKRWFSPSLRMVVGIPSGSTEVEIRAVRDSSEHAGGRDVYMVFEPMAAAIGVGIDVLAPEGNMIVDIGGGTTDVAVLSLGGIVTSSSIKIAGNVFDNDIIKYIREKYKLLVGDRTAEEIKFQIGTVFPGSKNEKMEVRGRDLVTGLPHSITLTSEEVEEALRESAYVIVNTAKSVLEQTPPELSADIIDKGIVITGGGALLDGIDQLLSHELKVPVFVAESPLTCVVEGTGVLLENIPLLESGLNKNY